MQYTATSEVYCLNNTGAKDPHLNQTNHDAMHEEDAGSADSRTCVAAPVRGPLLNPRSATRFTLRHLGSSGTNDFTRFYGNVTGAESVRLCRTVTFHSEQSFKNCCGEFLKLCSEWNVTVRHNRKQRSQQELQVDLCNACVQFLGNVAGAESVRILTLTTSPGSMGMLLALSRRGRSASSCTIAA